MNNKDINNNKDQNEKKLNFTNKNEKEINILLKNRIDLTKKIKGTKNEIFGSNWNHSSNIKLNTHNNDNILYKNKFIKNSPLRDKLINANNKNKGVILPEIKTPNLYINKDNINQNNNISSHFFKKKPKITANKNNEIQKENFFENTNFFKNIKINTNSNNLNDNTQATTIATNSTKKNTLSKINNEESSQYGMGLISVGSTTNNNIIIPLLTMNRPASNFNCGGRFIYNEKDSNISLNKKDGQNESNSNELFYLDKNKISRNKICKSQEMKARFNASLKNKEINNLFQGMQKFMPNFHKIKIEKGMTNIKLANSLHKKYISNNINYSNKLKSQI